MLDFGHGGPVDLETVERDRVPNMSGPGQDDCDGVKITNTSAPASAYVNRSPTTGP